jgi:hypothetical protein
MSQRTYSPPPTSICTHDELPPNVYGGAHSRSTKASISSAVRSDLPTAFVRTVTSRCFITADGIATGIEPRVPQNRISMAAASGRRRLRERLEPGEQQHSLLRLALLRRQHEHAQAGAADVLQAAEVEDHAVLIGGAALEMRRERVLEGVGVGLIDAAGRGNDDGVGEPPGR